jgi:hypothetical protein
LIALVPPPEKPVEVPSPSRINEIETRINLTLPDDLKQVINAYGDGKWQDSWFLYNPHFDWCFEDWRSPSDHDSGTMLLELPYMRMCRPTARDCGLEDWDSPLFPEEGGLLPWATTENGGCLFWLTEGGRSRWPTIYFPDDRRVRFERFELSCSEILYGSVSGTIPIFGDDSPSIANGTQPHELFAPAPDEE